MPSKILIVTSLILPVAFGAPLAAAAAPVDDGSPQTQPAKPHRPKVPPPGGGPGSRPGRPLPPPPGGPTSRPKPERPKPPKRPDKPPGGGQKKPGGGAGGERPGGRR